MDINLVLFKKDGSRKIFPLPSSVTVIGRRNDCELCIPLMSVSKRHCTYLNGKRIDEATIKAGDYIEVGHLTFLFEIDGQPETITNPKLVTQNLPGQDAITEDTADESFFAELDELDSLEETDST